MRLLLLFLVVSVIAGASPLGRVLRLRPGVVLAATTFVAASYYSFRVV